MLGRGICIFNFSMICHSVVLCSGNNLYNFKQLSSCFPAAFSTCCIVIFFANVTWKNDTIFILISRTSNEVKDIFPWLYPLCLNILPNFPMLGYDVLFLYIFRNFWYYFIFMNIWSNLNVIYTYENIFFESVVFFPLSAILITEEFQEKMYSVF